VFDGTAEHGSSTAVVGVAAANALDGLLEFVGDRGGLIRIEQLLAG
jgi:hypothetical protein